MEIGAQDLFAETSSDESQSSRGLIEDVVESLREERHEFARAGAFGAEWHAAGGELGGLARELSRIARLVDERLREREGTQPEDRRRVREAFDEATARSLEAFSVARRGRRDRWLSFHTHEMRNALNTIVNAHWILKNGEGKNTDRVFDMAERAVRRLENAVKELRDLETQVLKPAPGRPDKA